MHAHQLALNRTPTGAEVDRAIGFVEAVAPAGADSSPGEQTAWSRFLQTLFASTEFRLLD